MKMRRFIIDLNSFEVEANTKEEAIIKAEEMLKQDISLAYPFEVIEDEGDIYT